MKPIIYRLGLSCLLAKDKFFDGCCIMKLYNFFLNVTLELQLFHPFKTLKSPYRPPDSNYPRPPRTSFPTTSPPNPLFTPISFPPSQPVTFPAYQSMGESVAAQIRDCLKFDATRFTINATNTLNLNGFLGGRTAARVYCFIKIYYFLLSGFEPTSSQY